MEDQAQEPQESQEQRPAEEGRPEWLSSKFASVEDQARAYNELESLLGQRGQEQQPQVQPAAETQAVPQEGLSIPEAPAGKEDVFEEFTTKFSEKGDLSPEEIQQFAERSGVPESYVQSYITGVKAQMQQTQSQIYDTVGGAENYQEMIQWASKNVSAEDQSAFNKMIDSGDMGSIRLAVEALNAKFRSSTGKAPALVTGGSAHVGSAAAYSSTAEMMADMNSKKYHTDPAFREQVARRVAISQLY